MEKFTTNDKIALRITLIYAVIAAVWILLSYLFIAPVQDSRAFIILSVLKGWIFVIVTSALLYVLVQRTVARITNTQAQMQLLFNSVVDGMYLFKIDASGKMGKLIDVNEGAIKQTGYTRAELMSGPPYFLIPEDQVPAVEKALEQLFSEGQVLFETFMRTKSGSLVPVEVNSRIVQINGDTIGISVARDITERKRIEEERRQAALALERDKRRFYKETILAVTGGKFELCEPEESSCIIQNPEFAMEVKKLDDVAKARREVIRYCREQGLSEDLAEDFEIAVGEALANAIKHTGSGRIKAGKRGVDVWVAIIDHGTGIDTFALPKVAIMPGYSTKASMGLGYTLMLEVSDRVSLTTGPSGTIVILEKRLKPVSDIDRRIAVHGGIK